jgi:hypothetical protein
MRKLTSGRERALQGAHVAACKRIEQVLIDEEVEHHVDAIAFIAEILLVLLGQHVSFSQQHRIASAPLQELTHLGEVFEVLLLGRAQW